jgi:F-type H+-transporting ATPase subunit a
MSIEIITNVARILTLSVRLFGNMTGDHLVLSMFSKIVPFLAPIAPLALGLFVCFIQTLIFVLLSTMYIALAIEKSEH